MFTLKNQIKLTLGRSVNVIVTVGFLFGETCLRLRARPLRDRLHFYRRVLVVLLAPLFIAPLHHDLRKLSLKPFKISNVKGYLKSVGIVISMFETVKTRDVSNTVNYHRPVLTFVRLGQFQRWLSPDR